MSERTAATHEMGPRLPANPAVAAAPDSLGTPSVVAHFAAPQTDADWQRIDFSTFRPCSSLPRHGRLRANLWRLVGLPLVKRIPCGLSGGRFFNALRIAVLRVFGARIGRGVVIHGCEVVMPWNLEVDDHAWIGEGAILYNLVPIRIGSSACVSQMAFLCTGSHDVTDPSFSLSHGEIRIEQGAWVCARAFVGPGVTIHAGAVAAAGSVVVRDIPPMTIWGGNPCRYLKDRVLRTVPQLRSAA